MQNRIKELAIATRAALMRGWTKGSQARDVNGNPCSPTDDNAAAFCIVGAMEIARHKMRDVSEPCTKLTLILCEKTDISPVAWNDHPERTWDEVLSLFDDVIADFDKADTEAVPTLETVDA